MTKSYNVTTYGIKGQLLGKFKENETKKIITRKDDGSSFEVSLYEVPGKMVLFCWMIIKL